MAETNVFDGRKVLLVEDEFLIVDALVEVLQEKGIEVIGPAASVANALRLIEIFATDRRRPGGPQSAWRDVVPGSGRSSGPRHPVRVHHRLRRQRHPRPIRLHCPPSEAGPRDRDREGAAGLTGPRLRRYPRLPGIALAWSSQAPAPRRTLGARGEGVSSRDRCCTRRARAAGEHGGAWRRPAPESGSVSHRYRPGSYRPGLPSSAFRHAPTLNTSSKSPAV